jgi:hypothetical protein
MKTGPIAKQRAALEKAYARSLAFLDWLTKRIAVHEHKLAVANKRLQRREAVFDPCELGAQRQIDRARENIGELEGAISALEGRVDTAKRTCHSEYCQLNPVAPINLDRPQHDRAMAPRAPVSGVY